MTEPAIGGGSADVLVLGAGVVGVSIALHLQKRGRSVILVDRRGAGEETSYGNAGLIELASVVPYGFPRDLRTLLRYASNRSAEVRVDWSYLPRIAPWLLRFWRESSPERLARAAQDMWPLIKASLVEHEALMAEAGSASRLRKVGWIEAFRDERSFAKARRDAAALSRFGLNYDVLDAAALRRKEPNLASSLVGAMHWLDAATVTDPGAVVKDYADLLLARGGLFLRADARGLRREDAGWVLAMEGGVARARDVVVALGPWSDAVLRPLGYKIPLLAKRGYHIHFEAERGASLNHSLFDADGGVLLAPMAQGMRLTTGIELAPRDSAPTPFQIDRAERLAREILPLGQRVEPRAWMGSRPCLPDMRPVIGRAQRHEGLWFAFGHNHHGLTLGPVTGRLLAEMMTGETPFTDPAPYAVDRFQ